MELGWVVGFSRFSHSSQFVGFLPLLSFTEFYRPLSRRCNRYIFLYASERFLERNGTDWQLYIIDYPFSFIFIFGPLETSTNNLVLWADDPNIINIKDRILLAL